MPDVEMIHSTADVTSVLLFALDSGLRVRVDVPQPEPCPRLLERSEVGGITRGVFFLFQPEWVYGPLQILPIGAGCNAGEFFVSPRVNESPITLSFSGERIDEGHRRLGSGVLSYHRDWLELPNKIVRATPPEVREWFKRIKACLLTKTTINAGVHKYHLCKGVISDPNLAECLPPFDFIPWESWGQSALSH
jgi:hypothetical protein